PEAFPDPPQEDVKHLLDAWVEAAVLLGDVHDIVGLVRRLHRGADQWGRDEDEDETRARQNQLLYRAGDVLVDGQRWTGLNAVLDAFDLARENDVEWWLALQEEVWLEAYGVGDVERAAATVRAVLERVAPEQIRAPTLRIAVAEAALLILGQADVARKWLD